MYSITSTPQKYPKRFEEIYSLSKQFSANFNANFDEVFSQSVKFHDPRHSLPQIWEQLQINRYTGIFKMNPNSENANYSVWLTFGETGQGKSTFTNAICGRQEAAEGKGMKSKTEHIGLYSSNKHQITVIDTPGLFDTRKIKNKEISNRVVEVVQNKLKQNAHIDAIFFLWCPTSSMRLRFEEILATLKKALGDEAIRSVVFIINKVSHLWNQDFDELYNEFLDLLDENGLNNPVFECDLKQMNVEDIQELKRLANQVDPFRKEDFEAHRMMIYLNKFLEIQRIDEEKKRERESIEKEMGVKFEKKANEMEGKFRQSARQMEEKFTPDLKKQEDENHEKNKKLQEQYQAELEALRQQSKQLEIRLEKEKAEREAEEKRRREEDERRRQEEQRRREEEARVAQSYYPTYSSPPSYSYSPSYFYSTPTQPQVTTSTSASTDGMKFYKGGQFVPGGGHAPKGGCYMPVSSSVSQSVSSTNSGGGGGTFYKGGQFMPGGGRAPKGGAYA